MPSDPAVPGTSTWQPDYVRAHVGEQAGYLSTVSATSLMQQVSAQTHLLLDLKDGDAVLEVGCGNGVFLSGLAERVYPSGRVVGIDHADAFVIEAQKNAAASPHAKVISVEQADAYRLPFADASFDVAHCERVLMHLEDPTAAIREMARVVRPGGLVVVAEPDWAGMRFDHPDQEAFQAVYIQALVIRQKDVGLTLYRRFAEAGLVERHYSPVTTVFTDFATVEMYGLKLEPVVETLVAEGRLPAARLRAVVPALREASTAGTYYTIANFHVVAGTVQQPRERGAEA